jgi:hypothetical protein
MGALIGEDTLKAVVNRAYDKSPLLIESNTSAMGCFGSVQTISWQQDDCFTA